MAGLAPGPSPKFWQNLKNSNVRWIIISFVATLLIIAMLAIIGYDRWQPLE